MTLVAGFRCWDGFVIAADTEMALGSVSYQGQKLAMSGPNDPYTLCIRFAGDESCGLAVSQEIREAVAALKSPPFAKIKRVVCNIVAEFYPKHVLKDWSVIGEQPPDFRLVIGIRDHADKCGVLCTDRDVVHDRSVFIGSGNEIASYVRVALDSHFNQEADVIEGIDSRVDEIRARLRKLYADSRDEDTRVLGDGYEMFTTEYRTGVGRPFKDSV